MLVTKNELHHIATLHLLNALKGSHADGAVDLSTKMFGIDQPLTCLKSVSLPFLRFRMLRHGYLHSPIYWHEVHMVRK